MTVKVGIVAIGRNEGERLKACLGSLPDVPVVYVDSGSSDGSIDAAHAYNVEVVELYVQSSGEDIHCGILVKGSEDLHLSRDSSLLDQQPASSKFFFRVGRGEIILSVGTANNEFSLTPINLPPNVKKVEVSLKGVRAIVTKRFEEENR